MEDKGHCSRFVCTDASRHSHATPRDKNVLFLVQGGHFSLGKFIILGRKREGRELFQQLLFLHCFRLKITLLPMRHISGSLY